MAMDIVKEVLRLIREEAAKAKKAAKKGIGGTPPGPEAEMRRRQKFAHKKLPDVLGTKKQKAKAKKTKTKAKAKKKTKKKAKKKEEK